MPSSTPIRQPLAAETLREELRARLAEARRCTDALFCLLRPDALYDRPIPERHRIIFYLGHLEAFDWNLLRERVFGLPSFHPQFDRLFAFGIDPVDGCLPSDQRADWPLREEIETYNRRVREALDTAIARADLSGAAEPLLRNGFILHVAIEHRLMHAETLAYMFHRLPLERKIAPAVAPAADSPAPKPPRMIEIPTGRATLGRPRAPNIFGWDNEFEEYAVEVPAFSIGAAKVTNGQFLEFLRAGGYEDRALWSEEDWTWRMHENIQHPGFWTARDGQWALRTMFDEIPLPADWPVYVSHAEACAYARWAGKKLPTEAQFHRAAHGCPDGGESEYPWGHDAPAARHGNFDFARWDPVDVAAHAAGTSAFGVAGLVGNGWEWTSTVFAPFPGFEAFSFYPGYSADFFDGKHFVMKGGSARTAACMLRRSFRNWFQPHYPYVYVGFRCVDD